MKTLFEVRKLHYTYVCQFAHVSLGVTYELILLFHFFRCSFVLPHETNQHRSPALIKHLKRGKLLCSCIILPLKGVKQAGIKFIDPRQRVNSWNSIRNLTTAAPDGGKQANLEMYENARSVPVWVVYAQFVTKVLNI